MINCTGFLRFLFLLHFGSQARYCTNSAGMFGKKDF